MNNFIPFIDDRGMIETICKNVDVLRIKTNKGFSRASHFHKHSGHWSMVTHGNIKYYERPALSAQKPSFTIYKSGDLFWTDKLIEHMMVFDDYEDNEFLCFSTGDRDQIEYEKDLVRLDFSLKSLYDNWKD